MSDTCLKDETGRRHGKLVVLERAGTKKGAATWKCLCDCGAETIATGRALRWGKRRSCGCGWRLAAKAGSLDRATTGTTGTTGTFTTPNQSEEYR